MAGRKHKKETYNKNWESEIAAYDDEWYRNDEEFWKHALIIHESGSSELTDEENQVLTLYLNGVSCREIANQCEVEVEIIIGLLKVICAKLSFIE